MEYLRKKDIHENQEIKTVKLKQIHRQAESSTIVQLANCINSGFLPENLLQRQKDRNFIKLSDNTIVNNIISVIEQGISKGMNLLKEIQVLVPTYKGELGINYINDSIQEMNANKAILEVYELITCLDCYDVLLRNGGLVFNQLNKDEEKIRGIADYYIKSFEELL